MSKIIEICEDIIFIQKEKTKLILNPLSIISTRHQKLPSGRGPVYMDTWARCNDLLQERIATLVKTSGMSVEEVFTEPTSGGYKMPLRKEWYEERKGWYFEKGKMETPTIGVDFDTKEAARQMAITLAEGKEAIDNLSEAFSKEDKLTIMASEDSPECGA